MLEPRAGHAKLQLFPIVYLIRYAIHMSCVGVLCKYRGRAVVATVTVPGVYSTSIRMSCSERTNNACAKGCELTVACQ